MIDKLKQNIIRDISNKLDKLLIDISERDLFLERIESDIISKSEEYLKMNEEVEDARKELIDTRTAVRRELDILKKKNIEIKELRIKTDKRVSEAKAEVEQLTETAERKKQDIASIEKEIKSIEPMKKIKDSLEKEVEELVNKVKENRNLSKGASDELIRIQETTAKVNKAAEEELESIQKEIAKQREIVLPTLEELQEKEKGLKIKEDDLRVIEKRWKKLYAEKGAGFKI